MELDLIVGLGLDASAAEKLADVGDDAAEHVMLSPPLGQREESLRNDLSKVKRSRA
jgi:hypothetical protein